MSTRIKLLIANESFKYSLLLEFVIILRLFISNNHYLGDPFETLGIGKYLINFFYSFGFSITFTIRLVHFIYDQSYQLHYFWFIDEMLFDINSIKFELDVQRIEIFKSFLKKAYSVNRILIINGTTMCMAIQLFGMAQIAFLNTTSNALLMYGTM